MGCSLTDPAGCLASLAGGAAGSVADSAFSEIAKNFADAAGSAVNWLWSQISAATAISLTGPTFGKDLAIVTTLAVVVATGLFVIQVIASVLRRDPSGLARALKGLLVAFVGSVAAIAVTTPFYWPPSTPCRPGSWRSPRAIRCSRWDRQSCRPLPSPPLPTLPSRCFWRSSCWGR
jgi:hypothetical protein